MQQREAVLVAAFKTAVELKYTSDRKDGEGSFQRFSDQVLTALIWQRFQKLYL